MALRDGCRDTHQKPGSFRTRDQRGSDLAFDGVFGQPMLQSPRGARVPLARPSLTEQHQVGVLAAKKLLPLEEFLKHLKKQYNRECSENEEYPRW